MSNERATSILFQPDGIKIPAVLRDLEAFREWARSDSFPERGRIDWIGGEMEVDMSPEDLTTHGTIKAAIAGDLRNLIENRLLGVVLIDSTRLSSPQADLSVEPDVVVVLRESLEAGRLRLVPKAGGEEGRYVEIEGAADIVVECVSDSSERKDRRKLPGRYHRAGVREHWLVDARGKEISFSLLRHTPERFVEAQPDEEGFRVSEVLGLAVRLVRVPMGSGLVCYRLETRPR